jgi:NADPH-dependent F420 reductase
MSTFAVLGGTGNLGLGLARRLVLAGHDVVIGSRSSEKAEAAAATLTALAVQRGVKARVRGSSNANAASAAEIIFVAVPFAAQRSTLTEIRDAAQGKIVVDATVPLVPPKVARVQLPAEGSASRIAQAVLGPEATLVTAFHNVAADLLNADGDPGCDILVFGDNKTARERVIDLVEQMGLRGIHGGSLDNSAAAEALTSVLIFVNKHYGCHSGIRITGVPGRTAVDA